MKHIYICTSNIEGKGLNAGENVKKGDVIQYIKGEPRFLTVTNKDESLSYPNWIGISKDVWIDPNFPNQFLNHSCNPNASVRGRISVGKDGNTRGKYEIVALKGIKEGSEITIDYSIIEGDDLWEMKCVCGEKNCRGVIRSVNYLPTLQFKKYFPNIPVYFQNLYLKNHPEIAK